MAESMIVLEAVADPLLTLHMADTMMIVLEAVADPLLTLHMADTMIVLE